MIILDSNTIIYLSKGLINIDEVFKSTEQYAVSSIQNLQIQKLGI